MTRPPTDLEICGGPYPSMVLIVGEFHARDGLTFKRDEDGGVIIRRWIKEKDGWHFYSVTSMPLTAAEWKSVVSAVRP